MRRHRNRNRNRDQDCDNLGLKNYPHDRPTFSERKSILGPNNRPGREVEVFRCPSTFTTDNNSAITIEGQNIYGIGFGGVLPPGAFAIVQPVSIGGAIADGNSPSTVFNGYMRETSGAWVAYQSEVLILRAGEVFQFETPINEGLWVHSDIMGGVGGGASVTVMNTAGSVKGLNLNPYLTLYKKPDLAPDSIPYTKAPLDLLYTPVDELNHPTVSNAVGVDIPPGANRFSLMFIDDASSLPVQAAETGDYKIFWRSGYGIWGQNEADHWNAGGRGSVTDAHFLEVYELSGTHHAVQVAEEDGLGNAFRCVLTFAEV